MLQGKTIFITGGAGFIGSTLAGQLIQNNHVIIYDNFVRDALQHAGFMNHPNLSLVRGDILDMAQLEDSMSGATHVVHCAAIAGIDTVIRSPVTTMEVNMVGSANVLRAAHRVGNLERVVCFSTSEVFGQQAWRADEANATVMGAVGEARWTYAVAKLAEEHLALSYHKEHRLPTVVVRPFNVYGPGQVGEGAIRTFVKCAIHNQEIQIHGDGTQIRAWCYVDDMVRAVMLALEKPQAIGESFNIGNQRAVVTIYGLVNTILRVLDSKSPFVFVHKDYVDVELRVPRTVKALDLLGFEAQVDLEEGIQRTAEYYRDLERMQT